MKAFRGGKCVLEHRQSLYWCQNKKCTIFKTWFCPFPGWSCLTSHSPTLQNSPVICWQRSCWRYISSCDPGKDFECNVSPINNTLQQELRIVFSNYSSQGTKWYQSMENIPRNTFCVDQYALSESLKYIYIYFLANNWKGSCVSGIRLLMLFGDLKFCLLERYWGSSCGDHGEIQTMKILEASRQSVWGAGGGTPTDRWRMEVLAMNHATSLPKV